MIQLARRLRLIWIVLPIALCQCATQPIDQTTQSTVTVVSEPSASPEPASPTSPPPSLTAAPTADGNADIEAVTPAADPSATPATTPNANWISYNNQPIVEGHNWAWSPDGARLAFVLSCAEAEYESRLAVHDLETGAIVWERAFTGTAETFQPPGRVFWSPDEEYLLLDGPDIATRDSLPPTPIRRLAADGSGEPEIIVDRGYLLGIVSQWGEPWLRDR